MALALLDGNRVFISVITYLEMQCKPHINAAERTRIKSMLDECQILELTPAIQRRSIAVRLTTRMKLMDAIVGASAIEMRLPVVSSDDVFTRIRETQVIVLPPRSIK